VNCSYRRTADGGAALLDEFDGRDAQGNRDPERQPRMPLTPGDKCDL
jgi:hypothetical protein